MQFSQDQERWRVAILLVMALGVFVQLAGLLFNADGSRYATQLYLLLFIPSLLYWLSQRLSITFLHQVPGWFLLALVGWVLFTAGVNEGTAKGVGYWAKIVLLLLLYIFAIATLVREERTFTRGLLAACLVVALFAWLTLYYQYAVLGRPLEYPEIRDFRLYQLGWNGLADLDHPVVAGLYYGVFAVMLCWLFLCAPLRFWQATLLVLCGGGVLLYVLFTFSRGAWFSLAASIFVLLLILPNFKSRSLLGLSLIALVLGLYMFWPEIQAEHDVGLSHRDQIWHNWLQHLPDFWALGRGAGTDLHFRFDNGFEVFHAHSLYLQLWYEYGVIGIALFVSLLLSLLYKGWQCRTQPLACLGLALLVFAMVAMVSDVYAVFHRPSPYWVIVWLPIGILLGVQRPVPIRA